MTTWRGAILGLVVLLGGIGLPSPALAAGAGTTLAQQIALAVNQDRDAAGLPALTVDPRLVTVAAARAAYLLTTGVFSHCSGGEAATGCPLSGYDFVPRDEAAGIGVQVPGTTVAENLALNNYAAATAAAQTNAAWLASPEHKANIMDSRLAYTGVGVACCFAGTVGGTTISAADNVTVYVQEFGGGPGAAPPAVDGPAVGGSSASCSFVLGFATLAAVLPEQVHACTDDEGHNPANGDALQHTSGGLLVWRKHPQAGTRNWIAFTDGYHTWVNGPNGIAERLNTQRFAWEANPDGLPTAP